MNCYIDGMRGRDISDPIWASIFDNVCNVCWVYINCNTTFIILCGKSPFSITMGCWWSPISWFHVKASTIVIPCGPMVRLQCPAAEVVGLSGSMVKHFRPLEQFGRFCPFIESNMCFVLLNNLMELEPSFRWVWISNTGVLFWSKGHLRCAFSNETRRFFEQKSSDTLVTGTNLRGLFS